MDQRNGILWGVEESVNLHEDFDEAVEEYLDLCDLTEITELDVKEYKQLEIDPGFCSPLANFLEYLDQEFGHEEKTEPTHEMEHAELKFIEAVIKDYYVFQHDPTGVVVTVDVNEWIKKNRPDWLTEEK